MSETTKQIMLKNIHTVLIKRGISNEVEIKSAENIKITETSIGFTIEKVSYNSSSSFTKLGSSFNQNCNGNGNIVNQNCNGNGNIVNQNCNGNGNFNQFNSITDSNILVIIYIPENILIDIMAINLSKLQSDINLGDIIYNNSNNIILNLKSTKSISC